MRILFLCAFVLGGCSAGVNGTDSTSSSASGSQCNIDGLYLAEPAVLTSGSCEFTGEKLPESKIGITFTTYENQIAMQIQGAQGGCKGQILQGCKASIFCPLSIYTSERDEYGNKVYVDGTAQYSIKFDANGYSGTSSISIETNIDMPNGCSATYAIKATRQ